MQLFSEKIRKQFVKNHDISSNFFLLKVSLTPPIAKVINEINASYTKYTQSFLKKNKLYAKPVAFFLKVLKFVVKVVPKLGAGACIQQLLVDFA